MNLKQHIGADHIGSIIVHHQTELGHHVWRPLAWLSLVLFKAVYIPKGSVLKVGENQFEPVSGFITVQKSS